MMQLHKGYKKFEDKQTIIVVIGPDDASSFKKYWQDNGLEFYGIPDEKHSVLKMYGQQVDLFKLGRMPAQMLVDKQGILRYVHYGHSMQDIPKNSEIFQLIDKLDGTS